MVFEEVLYGFRAVLIQGLVGGLPSAGIDEISKIGLGKKHKK